MEYMIINHSDEADGPSPESADFQAHMGRWMAFNQMLIDNGHWVSGASLAGSAAATTVRKQGGQATIVDGPFIETKEQIGGYYLVEAADLDEAIRLASDMPIDTGAVEIRPIAFRPDALS